MAGLFTPGRRQPDKTRRPRRARRADARPWPDGIRRSWGGPGAGRAGIPAGAAPAGAARPRRRGPRVRQRVADRAAAAVAIRRG